MFIFWGILLFFALFLSVWTTKLSIFSASQLRTVVSNIAIWLLQLIPHKSYTALFHHLKQILFLAFTCKTVFCCSWRRIKTTAHYFLLVVDEDQQDGRRLVLEVAGSAKLSAFTAYGRAPVQPSATLSLPNATVCRSNLYQARKQCILWCSVQIIPSIMQALTKHQACD